ncbi:MAG: DUF2461 domain-containing protein [Flavipsychrobacter sp.]|jgi:uncharacterized protein (TIGR02453 family)|nr:DUF2461 domain-containing protein [Flavipsychrobacter sp.]
MIQQSTLSFLKGLKKNNDKSWFDVNRSAYETARKDVEQFVQSIIDAHAKKDPGIAELEAKKCMFRINRDVRFSKDKSPYKTNFGASINEGGKKALAGGYYIHIEPGNSFAGGGIYMPMPPELKKVRQEIDYNAEEFEKIVKSKAFVSTFGRLSDGEGMKLSRVPQGFDKDSPAAEYLVFKSYVAMIPLADKELTDPAINKKILKAFETLQPLLSFIKRSLE